MDNQQLKHLLRSLSDTPGFGGVPVEVTEERRKALLDRLGASATQRPMYTMRDWALFVFAGLMGTMVRPVAVGLASLVMVLGGSVLVVGASSASVPGDMLYPVKIASERVQFSLAASSEDRAKLAIEFAGRRLDEVQTLKTSSDGAGRVKEAVGNFRRQIATVNTHIQEVSQDKPEAAAALASLVEGRTEEYEKVIRDGAVLEEAGETQDELLLAKNEVAEANSAAVEILVETQERTPDTSLSSNELQELFHKDLFEIESRLRVISSRLEVIDTVLDRRAEDLGVDTVAEHRDLVFDIRASMLEVEPTLADARALLVAGGIRKTFDLTKRLKDGMNAIDEKLARLEIGISTAAREEEPDF
ncbi:MAG: hypothetical protein UY95_C0003G0009 [Parcubacteria group bacterium GW2011_GWA2_56_7]|nr:MAG: hypothetical protein UY95_C0003G0009 [Parcubacteria group bacterium GW2011_GWA2_56_7]